MWPGGRAGMTFVTGVLAPRIECLFLNGCSGLRAPGPGLYTSLATCQKASWRRKRLQRVAGEETARFPLRSRKASGPGPKGLGVGCRKATGSAGDEGLARKGWTGRRDEGSLGKTGEL